MEHVKNHPDDYLREITVRYCMDKNKFVYVDETGLDIYFYRKYGRALIGKPVYSIERGKKFERVSIVAAQNGHKIIEPLEYSGIMDGII